MQILDDTRRWQIRVMRLGRRWNTIPVVPLKINQVWWLLGFLASSSVEFRCATQVLSCAQPKHQAGWSHPRVHPEVEGRLGMSVAVFGRSLTFMSTPLRPFPTSPTSSRTEMRCETIQNWLWYEWYLSSHGVPHGALNVTSCCFQYWDHLRPSETCAMDFELLSHTQVTSVLSWPLKSSHFESGEVPKMPADGQT